MERILELDAFGSKTREPGDAMVLLRYQAFAFQGFPNDRRGLACLSMIKKNGEFVLPGFGKLVKEKRKARTGVNPKTQQKIKIPAKTVVKFRVAKAAKDGVLGVKT
jgi:hypothetical protein